MASGASLVGTPAEQRFVSDELGLRHSFRRERRDDDLRDARYADRFQSRRRSRSLLPTWPPYTLPPLVAAKPRGLQAGRRETVTRYAEAATPLQRCSLARHITSGDASLVRAWRCLAGDNERVARERGGKTANSRVDWWRFNHHPPHPPSRQAANQSRPINHWHTTHPVQCARIVRTLLIGLTGRRHARRLAGFDAALWHCIARK